MRIIDFIIYGIAISYGIAIAAAYTVGLHSGSTSNNHAPKCNPLSGGPVEKHV